MMTISLDKLLGALAVWVASLCVAALGVWALKTWTSFDDLWLTTQLAIFLGTMLIVPTGMLVSGQFYIGHKPVAYWAVIFVVSLVALSYAVEALHYKVYGEAQHHPFFGR